MSRMSLQQLFVNMPSLLHPMSVLINGQSLEAIATGFSKVGKIIHLFCLGADCHRQILLYCSCCQRQVGFFPYGESRERQAERKADLIRCIELICSISNLCLEPDYWQWADYECLEHGAYLVIKGCVTDKFTIYCIPYTRDFSGKTHFFVTSSICVQDVKK